MSAISDYLGDYMNTIQEQLQHYHGQHSHLRYVMVDLRYTELAQSSNQAQLARRDMIKLADMLVKQNIIASYIWVIEFTKDEGLHAHFLLYLNQEQSEMVAIMTAQHQWLYITQYEGFIEQNDTAEDVISYLSQIEPKALFKAHPETFIGIGQ